jgi:hypothetical protein
MITIVKDIEMELTPRQLAEEFCEMNGERQVLFFNAIAEYVKDWDVPFAVQCQAMQDEKTITKEGKKIIETLWKYLT